MESTHPQDELAIRFWREGDTEYRFTTQMIEVDADSRAALIRHAPRIDRLELRNFLRLDISFDVTLIPRIQRAEPAAEEEMEAGDAALRKSGLTEVDPVPIPEAADLASQQTSDATPPDGMENPVTAAKIAPVDGEVLDISAGGMRVLVHSGESGAGLMTVSHDFDGPFPLAGLTCQVTGQSELPEGVTLQLKFLDLPPQLEKEIVRKVYQNQVFESNPEKSGEHEVVSEPLHEEEEDVNPEQS